MTPSTDRPVRIAVQLQPQHTPDYARLRDAVSRSEDAGVDVVFNWDHFFPLYGDPDGAHFEMDAYNPAVDELIRLVNSALRR